MKLLSETFTLVALFLLFPLVQVRADDSVLHQTSMFSDVPLHKTQPTRFDVSIKAIAASDIEEESADPRLEGLGEKLKRLPYRSFRLLSESSDTISLLNKETFHFANGQTLCVRPVESVGDQITMWLKWKANDGMSILDTRVNFALGEPMVAGIEGQSEGSGTVLAITISPKFSE